MKENTELHQFELKRTIQLLQYELDGYTDPCKYCGKSGECNDRIPPTPFTRKSPIFDVRNSFWGYIIAAARLFNIFRKTRNSFCFVSYNFL